MGSGVDSIIVQGLSGTLRNVNFIWFVKKWASGSAEALMSMCNGEVGLGAKPQRKSLWIHSLLWLRTLTITLCCIRIVDHSATVV